MAGGTHPCALSRAACRPTVSDSLSHIETLDIQNLLEMLLLRMHTPACETTAMIAIPVLTQHAHEVDADSSL